MAREASEQNSRRVVSAPLATELTRMRETAVRSDSNSARAPACRFCGAPLTLTVVDLGMSPLCESYLRADQLRRMEPFYPLHVLDRKSVV